MAKQKSPYSCVLFANRPVYLNGQWKSEGQRIGFMKYVPNVKRYMEYADKNHPDWSYMNVYSRKTEVFLLRVVRDDPGTWVEKPDVAG